MRRRGFSLIEMLVVVAIAAILAALSAYSLLAVNELGRINGAGQTVANILRTARARAITERCTYVVQFNGPNYNPLAAPADVLRTPGTIIVWRKNDCRSNVGGYVPGLAANLRDRRVNDYAMQEFRTTVFFPVGIIPENPGPLGNRLATSSVSIGWQGDGTRMIWADVDSDGASTDTGFAGALPITFRSLDGAPDPNRRVTVPLAGPAVPP